MTFPMEQYIKDLEYIINIDSGSANIEGNRQIAGFFARKFSEAGFFVETRQAGAGKRPVVIAKTPGAEKFAFYLGGHMDTVFPDGTVKARPFRIADGCAFGPGTVDMKAGALLILYIARELMQTAPEIPLCIVLNSDEELGSPDSAEILRQQASLCRNILIFEGGRKGGKLVNERKGIAKFSIAIHGIASHSGTAPQKGASAVVELAHWIIELDRLKNYHRGTTVNVGLMEGGTALNMVAPYSKAVMEVRYVDPKEFLRVERALDKLAARPYVEGTRAEVSRLSHYPPLVLTEKTRALMQRLTKYELVYVKAGGTSDANRLADLDIPIIDGCGPMGGFPHSEKEFLTLETVPERFVLFCSIIRDIGKEG